MGRIYVAYFCDGSSNVCATGMGDTKYAAVCKARRRLRAFMHWRRQSKGEELVEGDFRCRTTKIPKPQHWSGDDD